jgi:DNA-binding NtrC family response regulator
MSPMSKREPDGLCCLVLDVRLPGMSGLEVQHKLIEAGVQIPIIFNHGPCRHPNDCESNLYSPKLNAWLQQIPPF